MADYLLAHADAAVADAIRQTAPSANESMIHRLRRKFRKQQDTLMAQARNRAASNSPPPRSTGSTGGRLKVRLDPNVQHAREQTLAASIAGLGLAAHVDPSVQHAREQMAASLAAAAMTDSLQAEHAKTLEAARGALSVKQFTTDQHNWAENMARSNLEAGIAGHAAQLYTSNSLDEVTRQMQRSLEETTQISALKAMIEADMTRARSLALGGNNAIYDMYGFDPFAPSRRR
ncbi:hypothetical protein [Nitrospirillum pindoramense]|nr:hypothetical protein [Nitrospirillum amazonense]